MPIFDTHSHLYFPSFSRQTQSVIQQCRQAEVTHQLQVGCDELSSLAAVALATAEKNFYATVGLHPCDVDRIGILDAKYHRYESWESYQSVVSNLEQLLALFRDLLQKNPDKILGIGETGLDFYHRDTPSLRSAQKDSLRQHLSLAREFDKAVILHSRQAEKETIELLDQELTGKPLRGVWHCFQGDLDLATHVTQKYHWMLGIGGVLTYDRSQILRDTVQKIPLEYLVLETDAPFLTPQPQRAQGIKINSPAYLPTIVSLIAKLKNMSPSAVQKQLFANTLRWLRLAS